MGGRFSLSGVLLRRGEASGDWASDRERTREGLSLSDSESMVDLCHVVREERRVHNLLIMVSLRVLAELFEKIYVV